MAAAAVAPMPPGLELPAGYVIRVNAVDPTTGAQVTGVTVTNLSILVDTLTGNLDLNVNNPILLGVST